MVNVCQWFLTLRKPRSMDGKGGWFLKLCSCRASWKWPIWFMLTLKLMLGVNGTIEINALLPNVKVSINTSVSADTRCEHSFRFSFSEMSLWNHYIFNCACWRWNGRQVDQWTSIKIFSIYPIGQLNFRSTVNKYDHYLASRTGIDSIMQSGGWFTADQTRR